MSEQPRRRRRQQIVVEEPQDTSIVTEEVMDEPVVSHTKEIEHTPPIKNDTEDKETATEIKSRSHIKSSSKPRKTKHNKKWIAASAVVVLVVLIGVITINIIASSPSKKYEAAQALMAKGEYAKAAENFEDLGSYEEASTLAMYCKACALCESGDYYTGIAALEALGKYKDSEMRIIYYSARYYEDVAGTDYWEGMLEAQAIYNTIPVFLDSAERVHALDTRIEEAKSAQYTAAVDAGENGDYLAAQSGFERLKNYSDSKKRITYYDIREDEDMIDETNQDAVIAIVARYTKMGEYLDCVERAATLTSKANDIVNAKYNQIMSLINENNYAEAERVLVSFGRYGNENVKANYYIIAEKYLAERSWEKASAAFNRAGNYSDAVSRINEPYYKKAEALLAMGEWEAASQAFSCAGAYSDALSRINEPYYKKAEVLLANGDESGAIAAFQEAGTFSDAADRWKMIYYQQADAKMVAEEWDNAIAVFEKIKTFSDAEERINEAIFKKANALTDSKNYVEALTAYNNLSVKRSKGVRLPITDEEFDGAYRACKVAYGDDLLNQGLYEQAKGVYADAEYMQGVTECEYQITCTLVETDPITAYWAFVNLGEYKDSVARAEGLYSRRFEEIADVDTNGLRIYGTTRNDNGSMLYGLLDENYHIVLEAAYSELKQIDGYSELYVYPEFILETTKVLYGIIDARGKIVAEPVYDSVNDGSNDKQYLKVRKNDYWGFVDAHTGKIVVKPEWKDAQIMYDNYAYVMNNLDMWGVIDEKGEVIRTPTYESSKFTYYSDCGCVVLSSQNKEQVLNYKGEVLHTFGLNVYRTQYQGNGIFRNGSKDELYDIYERQAYSFTYGGTNVTDLRKVGKDLFSVNYYDKNFGHSHGVLNSREMKIISGYRWDEEISYIPGPAQMDGQYGWIGADGTDVLAPEWDYMCEAPLNGCVIAGKFNAQGNLVYSVLADGTGKLIADGFVTIKSAEEFTRNTLSQNKEAYADAEDLLNQGDLVGAITAFSVLAELNYENAAQMLSEAYYRYAETKMEEEDWKAASQAYASAREYSDADSRIVELHYKQAEALLASGDENGAISAFQAAGAYSDADERWKKIYYQRAEALLAAEEWEAASQMFISAADYSDAVSRISEPYYKQAEGLLAAEKYREAQKIFNSIASYKDSVQQAERADQLYVNQVLKKIKLANVGDGISFGAYEQDNDKSNGKETIEWLVLAKKNNRLLVISKYALDCREYGSAIDDYLTWERSSLRRWLNNDFINAAFSSAEQKAIPIVTVSADKNPKYSTNPGNATQDKMFLLSMTEANRYFNSDSARKCEPTAYVVNKEVDLFKGYCSWWLRTPGSSQSFVMRVSGSGDINGKWPFYSDIAVRPAMWIDLK